MEVTNVDLRLQLQMHINLFLSPHSFISFQIRSYLSEIKVIMSIEVGQTAPDFTLYNTEQKEVSLEDLTSESNVVLLFFPLAFTGVCTQELCSARDDISKYQKLNATIVGISVDSIFTLAKFREEQKLPFHLLSDFNKDVAKKYQSLYDEFPHFGLKGVTKRSAFVIDKQGKIQYAEILADASKVPNFDQIKSTLEKLNN